MCVHNFNIFYLNHSKIVQASASYEARDWGPKQNSASLAP